MTACNYPHLHDHKQAHELLADNVNQRIKEFRRKELSAESLRDFLQDWVEHHIVAQDRDIIPYCQGKEGIIEQALSDAGLMVKE